MVPLTNDNPEPLLLIVDATPASLLLAVPVPEVVKVSRVPPERTSCPELKLPEVLNTPELFALEKVP